MMMMILKMMLKGDIIKIENSRGGWVWAVHIPPPSLCLLQNIILASNNYLQALKEKK